MFFFFWIFGLFDNSVWLVWRLICFIFYFLFICLFYFCTELTAPHRTAPLGWTETGVDRFLPLYMWGAVRHEETAPYRCGAKIPPITGRTEPCTALIWTYMFYVFIEIIRMCNITFCSLCWLMLWWWCRPNLRKLGF